MITLLISAALITAACQRRACAAEAEQEIMKISDVKVGMKGIGRTVVSGSKIEEFDVEILGVLKNSKLEDALQISGSSFLIQVSGEVIVRSGGIAAGMSGSPVYIDKKLVGAISSGWIMADHSMGLMTPAEDMMTLTRYMAAPPRPVDVNELIDRDAWLFIEKSGKVPAGFRGVEVCSAAGAAEKGGPGMLRFVEAATPLLVSGLNQRSFGVLAGAMRKKKMNFEPVDLKGSPADGAEDFNIPDLSPGHAVAAQLVRGDINVSAIGTLTYLKDKVFLAFGHSFLKQGNVNFFFTPANIYYCFSSQEMPFKIGSPGKLIGSVRVDRNEGIAGVIGENPHVINVTVNVRDLDSRVKKSFSAEVADDERMFAELLEVIVVQSADEGINRQGAGFSKVSYAVSGKGAKSGEFNIRRRNYYYDEADISTASAGEVVSTVKALVENLFERVEIFDVTVDIDVTTQDPRARVGQIMISAGSVAPGDTIEASVKVEPAYKKSFIETVAVPVPVNLAPGEYYVRVTNGSFVPEDFSGVSDLAERPGNSLEVRLKRQVASLPDLVGRLNSGEKSNQLKFEFEPASDAAAFPGEKESFRGSRKKGAGSYLKEFEEIRGRQNDETPGGREKDKGRGRGGERGNRGGEGIEKLAGAVGRVAGMAARTEIFRKEGVADLISALKSELSERRPPSDDDNYKFFRSIEYLVEPFEARFAVSVGE